MGRGTGSARGGGGRESRRRRARRRVCVAERGECSVLRLLHAKRGHGGEAVSLLLPHHTAAPAAADPDEQAGPASHGRGKAGSSITHPAKRGRSLPSSVSQSTSSNCRVHPARLFISSSHLQRPHHLPHALLRSLCKYHTTLFSTPSSHSRLSLDATNFIKKRK